MKDQSHFNSRKNKYLDYQEKLNKESFISGRSVADLGLYHPNLITFNVFVETLVHELFEFNNFKSIVKVCIGEFFIRDMFLNHLNHTELLTEKNKINLFGKLPTDKKFDLVLSSFPWSLKINKYDDPDGIYKSYIRRSAETKIKVSFETLRSLDCMKMLSKKGLGICLFPSCLRAFTMGGFREILEDNNLCVQAIMRCPKDILKNLTAVRPILVIVGRVKTDDEFIIDLESVDSLTGALNSFQGKKSSNDIKTGIWMPKGEFKNFSSWHYQDQLEKISGDFSNYTQHKIKDICTIHRGRGGKYPKVLEEHDNSVYLPTIGNRNAVIKKDELQLKEQNILQLIFDESKVLSKYVAAFLNSEVGKFYIENHKTGIIPTLNLKSIKEMDIGIPSIDLQNEIVRNIEKVNVVKEKIEEYANGLSINPISDKNAISKVDQMIEIVSELSEADRLRSIIRRGEDTRTEFKETLTLDVVKQTKEKYISTAVFKNIAGFFNAKGGELLIGVDDESEIKGIDKELEMFHKGSTDKFLNTFKDLFKSYIGLEFYSFVDQKIVEINSKKVFAITCKPSKKEVFDKEGNFYIRTSPATEKLEGPRLVEYIRQRFN